MSMISRYQKQGGFLQLLSLVETCGLKKQEKLLQTIEEESMGWAHAIRRRMLKVETIFSWDSEVVAEILPRLQTLTIAIAIHGIDKANWERVSVTLSHSERRKIDSLSTLQDPSPADLMAAFCKIIQEVRSMISHGYINIREVDPNLVIDEEIEAKISNGSLPELEDLPEVEETDDDESDEYVSGFGGPVESAEDESDEDEYEDEDDEEEDENESPLASSEDEELEVDDLVTLKRENHELRQENAQLKMEIRELEEEIEAFKSRKSVA